MDITKLTSKEFSQIMRLLKDKEALQAKLAAIDKQLASLQQGEKISVNSKDSQSRGSLQNRNGKSGGGKKAAAASVSKKKSQRSKPVPLKKLIVELLQGAGNDGLHVKDIAERLNLSTNNIFSWFYTTGRKFKNIIKVAEGRFAWSPNASTSGQLEGNTGEPGGQPSGDAGGATGGEQPTSEGQPQI